jgi:predicted TIM-barrel fold metal-dependent hydrolase
MTTSPHRIDVHHHISPPTYLAAAAAAKVATPPTLGWTLEKSLGDMDRAGVATAVTSLTTPATSFLRGEARARVTRESNEFAARLGADHPGRFGNFAALPLPDVDASLREIEYALDTLHATGIGVLTSYDNRWLGDPVFAPLLDELDRRRAIVFVHPTTPVCCENLLPDIPGSVIEYATDTTRTLASLLFSGTAARCQHARFIFCHAGGTMPFLIERFTRLPEMQKSLASRVPKGVLHELRRFHYDVAQASHAMALRPLLELIPISQVLFGSDFPFRTSIEHVESLFRHGFSAENLRAVEHENARRVLGLKAVAR